MLGAMKTFLAAVVSIAFLAPAAMACPGHDSAEGKTAKKDEKAPTKQADAKPAPAPAPQAPNVAPSTTKPAPKASAAAAKPAAGKVSQR